MRWDAVELEEARLDHVETYADYKQVHERHRVFPAVFENRHHRRILDIAAGVGVVAKRIKELYDVDGLDLVGNDISPKCLRILNSLGVKTLSFDIDDPQAPFPLADGSLDAIVCLSTLEHVLATRHFLRETFRVLAEDGCLYLSTPNYTGLLYLLPFLLTGRTFHNPLGGGTDPYEFYGHVRYFTYRSLRELAVSFGFVLDTVYLALPELSSNYVALRKRSRIKASVFRLLMHALYRLGSPRWASEPILCLRKPRAGERAADTKPRKVIL